MLKQLRRALASEFGATIVEFALVAGISTILFVGLLDLTRLAYVSTLLQAGAQEGARYGIAHFDDTNGIQQAALERLVGIDPDAAEVTITYPSDDEITVTITYDFELITAFAIDLFNGNPIVLRGSATMVR
ncbi:MAG: pilus assembly protein [Chloroflexi bacterium]|nr:MAG: pilus assembly protein [Chloroflexota bacterium]